MSGGGEMAVVDPGRIRVEGYQAKGLEHLLPLDKDLIRPAPQHLRQDPPSQMVKGLPPPALGSFALPETPPLIDRRLAAAHLSRHRFGAAPLHDNLGDGGECAGLFFTSPLPVVGLTCRTRALSRTPLPWRVIAILCRFTSGKHPGSAYARLNVRPQVSSG